MQLRHYSGTMLGEDLLPARNGYITNYQDLHIWKKVINNKLVVSIIWHTFEGVGKSVEEAWKEIQTKARKADDEFCKSLSF